MDELTLDDLMDCPITEIEDDETRAFLWMLADADAEALMLEMDQEAD